jgi:hypothetical protein
MRIVTLKGFFLRSRPDLLRAETRELTAEDAERIFMVALHLCVLCAADPPCRQSPESTARAISW